MQIDVARATTSLVWPQDLITVLQQIMATPSRAPSKPLFEFNISSKYAHKNYVLWKHKFGGNIKKTLPAQQELPLGYI
jgi:hypothetical protein